MRKAIKASFSEGKEGVEKTVLRRFEEKDSRKCYELLKKCLSLDKNIPPETRREMINYDSPQTFAKRAEDFLFLVLEAHGEIVGMGGLEGNEIRTMFVDPAHQGKRHGTKILEKLEKMVNRKKHSTVFAYSTKTSQGFYEKNGYAAIDEKTFYINNQPLETVLLVKELKA